MRICYGTLAVKADCIQDFGCRSDRPVARLDAMSSVASIRDLPSLPARFQRRGQVPSSVGGLWLKAKRQLKLADRLFETTLGGQGYPQVVVRLEGIGRDLQRQSEFGRGLGKPLCLEQTLQAVMEGAVAWLNLDRPPKMLDGLVVPAQRCEHVAEITVRFR